MESVQLQSGGQALSRLKQQLPTRLLRVLQRSVLSARGHDETIELSLALELLLAVDQALCGGSGQVLRRAATALSSRILAHGRELVSPGETVRTLKCLRAPFEQPFVNVTLEFDVQRTPVGFMLSVSLPGYAQASPVLGAFALGYAQSAVTFSGDHERVFGLSAESFGERALIVGRISTSNPSLTKVGAADNDRTSLRARPPTRSRPSLAAVVEQILSGQPSNALPSRNAPSGERSAERGAETPPAQPIITTVTETSTAKDRDPTPRGGRRSSTG
ncbi:MAG: hypothetical protein ABW217_00625 [Polyangiaceae bacterium]